MISIREYTAGDWDAICRVHDRARPDELRGSCDQRAFVPLAEDPETNDVHRSEKLVAHDGERVVGFVGVDQDYLSDLYVDPKYYGHGIGRRLLRLGLELAGPGAFTVALASNARALALYRSEAFAVARKFESENTGYPCTCLRLELDSGHG